MEFSKESVDRHVKFVSESKWKQAVEDLGEDGTAYLYGNPDEIYKNIRSDYINGK